MSLGAYSLGSVSLCGERRVAVVTPPTTVATAGQPFFLKPRRNHSGELKLKPARALALANPIQFGTDGGLAIAPSLAFAFSNGLSIGADGEITPRYHPPAMLEIGLVKFAGIKNPSQSEIIKMIAAIHGRN